MYLKGSEWRRWDLHIHTPETKKNDNYAGSTIEEKWDNFYKAINDYFENSEDERKDVAVMGVTDYLSIDNYEKVIKDKRLPDRIVGIFPNVEMRIIPTGTNSPVNIHFIFNPDIAEQLEERFFANLKFNSGIREYSASKKELISLGREQVQMDISEEEAYKKGIEMFVVSYKEIQNLFQKDLELRENTLIGVSNKSTDGASGIARGDNGGQLLAAKKAVYRTCDFIFSSSPKDIAYFCGKGVDSKEDVICDYGSLKPCFHGSDAHSIEKIFEPDEERYCWIKADPTFNGLKQVIYEPEARVRISSYKPEEKSDYYVIDKVMIEDDDFSPEPIYFNDKLSCIIGGKSTGKSLLLQNIARAIDNKQVEEKLETSGLGSKTLDNIRVYWKDGEVNKKGEYDLTHKIVYIPQTYLNRLTDNGQSTSEIDKIIHDIIMLDDYCKSAYEKLDRSIKQYKPELDKKIYDLLQINETIETLLSERNEIGTESGIKKEIEKLNKQKEEISKKSDISEENLKEYDLAIKNIAEFESIINALDRDLAIIKNIDMPIQTVAIDSSLSDEFSIEIKKFQDEIYEEVKKQWKVKHGEIATKILLKHGEIEQKIKEANSIKIRLSEKVEESEALSKITEQIKEENKKLESVLVYSRKIDETKKNYESLLADIVMAVCDYKEIHNSYSNVVNQCLRRDEDGLDFSVKVLFRSEAFLAMIKDSINSTSLKKSGYSFDNEYNENDYAKDTIRDIVDKIIKGDIKLLKNKSTENVVREILSNWYIITYDVTMENDNINQMSPGKKALVLLKMLISMADSSCPILIDQPEDDLDNRSIFDELIPFIRDKKVHRQIIIVTHNANVVLGGDSEEVIIANQSGNNSPNELYRFEYRTGSIENDKSLLDEAGNVRAGILNSKGIQQHICDILEGGQQAFDLRKNKYRMTK